MHHTRACLTGERSYRCLDDASLLHTVAGRRERAVRDGAFQSLEGPRRCSLFPQKPALVVEQTRTKSDHLTWFQYQFGRHHLQVRRFALADRRRFVHGEPGHRFGLLRPNRIHRIARHEKDAPARNGSTRKNLLRRPLRATAAHDAVRQIYFAEHVAAVRLRADDVKRAIVGADVDLSVGEDGRRLLSGAKRELPQLLAARDVERFQMRTVVDLIDTRPVYDWR